MTKTPKNRTELVEMLTQYKWGKVIQGSWLDRAPDDVIASVLEEFKNDAIELLTFIEGIELTIVPSEPTEEMQQALEAEMQGGGGSAWDAYTDTLMESPYQEIKS